MALPDDFPALRVTEATYIRLRDLDIRGECVEIWKGKGLSDEKQRELADYVGLTGYDDVIDAFSHAGDESLVKFYALRGRVGKLYLKFDR
ncbi:hypothetical protein [Methanolobus halotolerans]|uniref:Uncharacterized protein n=1 Tax=Methanolobus halotolerans TaxID=2052935 RepID=A0A4E0QRW0_9EURY|nr:hypothetical protein [Methanolobus halotolerans]TGC09451.1 hypothetical protein CUN85_06375 [Methanolobus halotolerans]